MPRSKDAPESTFPPVDPPGKQAEKQEDAADLAPVVLVDEPKTKAKQAGHTVCRVTGTDVMYHGQYVKEGSVGEFEDAIVLDMPKVFVSLE